MSEDTSRSTQPRMRPPQVAKPAAPDAPETPQARLAEIRRGYRKGAEDEGVDPTRFGDWEYGGRCTDF